MQDSGQVQNQADFSPTPSAPKLLDASPLVPVARASIETLWSEIHLSISSPHIVLTLDPEFSCEAVSLLIQAKCHCWGRQSLKDCRCEVPSWRHMCHMTPPPCWFSHCCKFCCRFCCRLCCRLCCKLCSRPCWLNSCASSLSNPSSSDAAKSTFVTASFFFVFFIAHTHRRFCTQTLLHTDAFTQKRFHTQTLLHTDAFTNRCFLHTDAFAHRRFYTQTLLHTNAFTHRHIYTQMLLRKCCSGHPEIAKKLSF